MNHEFSSSDWPEAWFDGDWDTDAQRYFDNQLRIQVERGIFHVWSRHVRAHVAAMDVEPANAESVERESSDRRAELPLALQIGEPSNHYGLDSEVDYWLVKVDPASGAALEDARAAGISTFTDDDGMEVLAPRQGDEQDYSEEQRQLLFDLLRWQQEEGLLLPPAFL